MRTNPFLDAWLFLIGATPDQEARGAFRYVMVALFLGLLAASLWIAVVNWRQDPGQRTGTQLATFVCRVLIGSMWFHGPKVIAASYKPRWVQPRIIGVRLAAVPPSRSIGE